MSADYSNSLSQYRSIVNGTFKNIYDRKSVDDSIEKEPYSYLSDDRVEEDNTKYLDEYIKTSPQEAVLSMHNVIVGIYADGSAILYDLVNIGSIKITEALITDTDNSHLYSKESASANNNLTHCYENVNIRFLTLLF